MLHSNHTLLCLTATKEEFMSSLQAGFASPRATICLVEDDPQHESDMKQMLNEAGYDVISFSNIEAFEMGFNTCIIDAMVLDFKIGNDEGIRAIEHLRRLGISVPFLIVTGFGTVEVAVRCMKLGAITILEKPLNQDSFVNTVGSLVQISAELKSRHSFRRLMLSRFQRLTAREAQVLKLVMQGKSSKEIAKLLECSSKTVDVHRSRIVTKLEVTSINELLHGLIISDLDAIDPNLYP